MGRGERAWLYATFDDSADYSATRIASGPSSLGEYLHPFAQGFVLMFSDSGERAHVQCASNCGTDISTSGAIHGSSGGVLRAHLPAVIDVLVARATIPGQMKLATWGERVG